MKNVLYIGNKLSSKNANITTIETLGHHLKDEGYLVTFSSTKKNKVFRLIDMVISVFKNRNKVDYVLIDTYSTQNFYYALIVSKLCRNFKLKYIPILHGGNLVIRLKNSPKQSHKIFDNAYVNVSPSRFLKANFEDYGYKNVTYIPNTINIENYNFKERKIDKPKLFWLRSYKKIYNPQMAIRVAKKLKEKEIDYQLCMVGPDGDGSYNETKNLAKRLNVEVSFHQKLSKKEWIELSNSYNIFINTSRFDNMPVSLIEAMALGMPIISTSVGGIPFLLENETDAFLVDDNNVEQMVNCIKKVISQPDIAYTYAKKAREKAEKLDWKIVKKQWVSLLK